LCIDEETENRAGPTRAVEPFKEEEEEEEDTVLVPRLRLVELCLHSPKHGDFT
jgi:hypothetical protein